MLTTCETEFAELHRARPDRDGLDPLAKECPDDVPCRVQNPDSGSPRPRPNSSRPRRSARTARPGRLPRRRDRASGALGRLGRRDLRARCDRGAQAAPWPSAQGRPHRGRRVSDTATAIGTTDRHAGLRMDGMPDIRQPDQPAKEHQMYSMNEALARDRMREAQHRRAAPPGPSGQRRTALRTA